MCQNQGGSLVPVDHNNAQILSNIFALAFIKNKSWAWFWTIVFKLNILR